METVEAPTICELAVLDGTGDSKLMWDRNKPDEVAAARAHFQSLRDKGYAAFKTNKQGDRGEQIHSFLAEAERIIMVPPHVGG
jgi:hypothetical protein